jgi:hypothetical protein
MKERPASDGANPVGSTSGEFAALIRSELKRWQEVVRISGARID